MRVERGRGLARDGVVGRDGAALLGDLPRRVEADDAFEPGLSKYAWVAVTSFSKGELISGWVSMVDMRSAPLRARV